MAPKDLLDRLTDAGLSVAVDGDNLVVWPRKLLTDELRAAIGAHKPALIAELPRYRWLIVAPDGNTREVCCLPEMTATELAPCYPSARLVPLPDSPASNEVRIAA